ncbi:MAG: hypothetical protein IJZ89_06115 [Clostridia bacterium]|nr:hypothetical protein [Clostridia bacterium]
MKRSILNLCVIITLIAAMLSSFALVSFASEANEIAKNEYGYVSDGLVAYYGEGGDTENKLWKDLSGNNNDFSVTLNTANYFDAEGGGLKVGSTQHYLPEAVCNVLLGESFTIELHISDFVDTDETYNRFVHYGEAFSLFRNDSSDTLYLKNGYYPSDDESLVQGERPSITKADKNLQNDLVTLTYDADGKTAFYLNGELITSVSTSGKAIGPKSTDKLCIGEGCDAFYRSMRFYNRVLTEEEIKSNVANDGLTPSPSYISVAQPVTNVIGDISAVREINSAEELAEVIAAENKPSTAIFTVDSSLKVLDDSGAEISKVLDVIAAMEYKIIPVFRAEDIATAEAVAACLEENFTDAFIMSSVPAALNAARTVAPNVGGVIDYTNTYALKVSLTEADCSAIRSEIYSNNATVAMLPAALCDTETVHTLLWNQVGVWARLSDAPTETERFAAIKSGTFGVVSDDTEGILATASSLPENTITRRPINLVHRGATDSETIVKNTYESVVYAYEQGAKYIEFDIHMTAPEEGGDDSTRKIVLHHDANTSASNSIDGTTVYDISETAWSVLYENMIFNYTDSAGNITGSYKLSDFEDVCKYFAGEVDGTPKTDCMLFVEAKAGNDVMMIEMLYDLIKDYGLEDQFALLTFETSYIKKLREIAPHIPTTLLVSNSNIVDSNADMTLQGVRELVMPINSIYEPAQYNSGDNLGKVSARALLKRGIFLYVWSSGSEIDCTAKGYNGITSDNHWLLNAFPWDITVSGIREDGLVSAGGALDISAYGETYDESVALDGISVKILEGADLVKALDGRRITFGENTGNVTFAAEYSFQNSGYTFTVYSDPVTVEITDQVFFDGAVKTEGFAIRMEEYNGLRGLFSFDTNKNAAFIRQGYELIEYGAIAVSEEVYKANGNTVTLDPETFELTCVGYKAPVRIGDKYQNKTLGTKDGIESYCLAITNFEKHFNDNVYFCAYSVYKDPNGEPVITLKDYGIEGYNTVNLYQLTLDMYVNGAINAYNTDVAAVWNTLLTGVVTLSEGTDYVESETFGDTFIMKEFAACGTAAVAGITLTVVNDPKNDEWILIYRGEGNIPGTGWDIKHQLASERAEAYALTNPILTAESDSKITTVIIDYGITGISGAYSFAQLNFDTLVYSDTFKTTKGSMYYHCPNIVTAYKAMADGEMHTVEERLADYSHVDNLETGAMFVNVSAPPSKIHLPSTLTAIANNFLKGAWSTARVTKIWCGDTVEPEAGVIDLTGANIVSIGAYAFPYLVNINTIKLPDSCTTIDSTVFTDADRGTTPIKTVMQNTYNASIAEFCTTNGYTYCNLSGTVHTAPAE